MIKDQNEKLAALTEQLREEARHEINATAKAAISQSDTQFKTISTLKSKIFKLRQENVELRNNFREQMTREAAMQELLDRTTIISERREVALRKVIQKALEHATISKNYEKLVKEKETLKRDLQQSQVQLDASTKLSCDVRESSAEKSIALDLLSTKLQEEGQERKKLEDIIHSSLQLLQDNIFSKPEDLPDGKSRNGMLNSTLKLLVDLLSEGANAQSPSDNSDQFQTLLKVGDKKEAKNKPLATYTAGDLGLIPKVESWK